MKKNASSRGGRGYWGGQIGSTALLGIGCIVGSLILSATMDSDEQGGSVLLAVLGMLFLTTCAWAIDAVTRSSSQERALFAWAIAQHEAAGHGNDAMAMRDAAHARDGELDVTRIRALQALRTDNPYPGDLRHAEVSSTASPSTRKGMPNRTGLALFALFLALIGLYASCFPATFILGWPFQLVASVLAVIAFVPRGRARRLGVAAMIVAVLGTVVTVVMLVLTIVNPSF